MSANSEENEKETFHHDVKIIFIVNFMGIKKKLSPQPLLLGWKSSQVLNIHWKKLSEKEYDDDDDTAQINQSILTAA